MKHEALWTSGVFVDFWMSSPPYWKLSDDGSETNPDPKPFGNSKNSSQQSGSRHSRFLPSQFQKDCSLSNYVRKLS